MNSEMKLNYMFNWPKLPPSTVGNVDAPRFMWWSEVWVIQALLDLDCVDGSSVNAVVFDMTYS